MPFIKVESLNTSGMVGVKESLIINTDYIVSVRESRMNYNGESVEGSIITMALGSEPLSVHTDRTPWALLSELNEGQ